jgi:hypothetical protein
MTTRTLATEPGIRDEHDGHDEHDDFNCVQGLNTQAGRSKDVVSVVSSCSSRKRFVTSTLRHVTGERPVASRLNF